jgi:glycosyltransferase involved in cell wall biosynthesis
MSARIVVAHAGRQHSHQLAAALHERGALHEYWTGLPLDRGPGDVSLPKERVRVTPIGSGAHFLERHLSSASRESVFGQLGDYAVDAIYAQRLRSTGPVTAVVAYENGALKTLRAARELGLCAILDAASVHHAAGDAWRGTPPRSGWARDVRGHKDEELRFADHILVLSELAKETYVAAGLDAARIHVVPPGYDSAIFRPRGEPQVGAPLRFVFAGNAAHTKGYDVLLEAAARLAGAGVRFRLVVIGDVRGEAPSGVELRGKLPQGVVAEEFARADCLVLPSRCDGFGLVVAEALGSGLPAIVSEHVGARDLVRESGAGWIVAADDAAALAARMRACVDEPQSMLEAKRKARAAAGAWTWERYRARVADTVLGLAAHG